MVVRETFLAIDPGSHQTGLALFQGEKLLHWKMIKAPRSAPSYERIGYIMAEIQEYLETTPGAENVTLVACEQTTAIEGRQPAPELATLIRAIKSWTSGRQKGQKTRRKWVQYNPSTVLASVRPNRAGRGRNSKDLIHHGVRMLYEETIRRETEKHPELEIGEGQQDIYDAIAVGHCHFVKTETQSLNEIWSKEPDVR